ncbi:MAG: hypothetical protein ABW220_17135 [Burkholderiaceae bacterium]
MLKLMSLMSVLVCALLSPVTSAFAGSTGQAEVRLQAWQVLTVVEQASVKEKLQPLQQVRPGDVVEYEARYVNGTAKATNDVQITLPVPAGGMQFLPQAGALTPPQFASLDGKRFEPIPLKREVRSADGRKSTVDVPAAEYRYLRWNLGALPVGAERAVRARMQLPALDAASRP